MTTKKKKAVKKKTLFQWWNWRVVRHNHKSDPRTPEGEECFMVHEAYYSSYRKKGDALAKPHSISKEGLPAMGNSFLELKMELEKMTEALNKPVLEAADF